MDNTLDDLMPDLRRLLPASLRGAYLDGYVRRRRTPMELLLSRSWPKSLPNVKVSASTFDDVRSEIRSLGLHPTDEIPFLQEIEQALAFGKDTRSVVARAVALRDAGARAVLSDMDSRYPLEHRSVIDRLRDDEMSVDRRNAALQVFRFALSQWALARMVSREQRPTEDALDFIVNAWIAGLDTFAIIMPELQESLDAISTTDEALQGSEEAFLSDVYRLVEENLSRKAIAQVFDFLDDKVLAADFEACDRILRAVDLDRLDASTALGFLSITTQVRDRLSHRNGLLQRIERHLLQQRSPEYVETLLRGLR